MKFSLIAAVVVFALAQGCFAQDVASELEKITQYWDQVKTKMTEDLTAMINNPELLSQAQAKMEPLLTQAKTMVSNAEEQLKPMAENVQTQMQPLMENFQQQLEAIFLRAKEQIQAIGN